jgi:hypothetical protein
MHMTATHRRGGRIAWGLHVDTDSGASADDGDDAGDGRRGPGTPSPSPAAAIGNLLSFRIGCLLLPLLFCACTAVPLPEGAITMEGDEGAVVINFRNNIRNVGADPLNLWSGYVALAYYQEGQRYDSLFKLRNNDDTQVHVLKAGHYKLRHLEASKTYLSMTDASGFDVAPGKVTYLGDVILTIDCGESECALKGFRDSYQVKFGVADQADRVQAHLEKAYPDLLREYPLEIRLLTMEPKPRP